MHLLNKLKFKHKLFLEIRNDIFIESGKTNILTQRAKLTISIDVIRN